LRRGALLVLLAATLWGTLGVTYKLSTEGYGLTPLTIVFWRAALAALCLGLFLALIMPLLGKGLGLLKVRRADLPLLAAFGFLGITAFFLLYIYAVVLVGVTVAVVLLYTAPVFVAVMAWRWLGEGFGPRRALALALTFLGCVLVARAYDLETFQVNALGIACGLGSAFTYALYSILGKVSLGRGVPIATMSFYVYGIGALGLLAVALVIGFVEPLLSSGSMSGSANPAPAGVDQLLAMGDNLEAWGLLLVLALGPTLGALWAYTAGLRHLNAGVASILATFEPLVAALLAYFILSEQLEWPQLLGGALILGAVLVLRNA
jgi:DME family drug/metabolite transporter